jgi:predicted alpha/beta hydrolase family esterase
MCCFGGGAGKIACMSKTVGIFHGYGGNKPSSWLTWLNMQLVNKGYNTIYPSFPFLGSSTIEEWDKEFSKNKERLVEPISLVGHSGGTTFALYVAQHSGLHFEKLILVCPLNDIQGADMSSLVKKPEIRDQVPYIRNFIHQNFDYDLIKSRVDSFVFVLSDNDPNVPYAETKQYFMRIFPTAKFITLHDYGHVNEKAGVTQLPEVLQELE